MAVVEAVTRFNPQLTRLYDAKVETRAIRATSSIWYAVSPRETYPPARGTNDQTAAPRNIQVVTSCGFTRWTNRLLKTVSAANRNAFEIARPSPWTFPSEFASQTRLRSITAATPTVTDATFLRVIPSFRKTAESAIMNRVDVLIKKATTGTGVPRSTAPM